MKVKDLIKQLSELDSDAFVYVAGDEEHNDIFTKFYITKFKDAIILAGLSGTELI